MFQKAFPSFIRIAWLNFMLMFIGRMAEYFWLDSYHEVDNLFKNEIWGFCFDILIVNTFSVSWFLVYAPLYKYSPKTIEVFSIVFSLLIFIFHICILQYFIRVMIPLDKFFYMYTSSEVMVAIKTAEVNYTPVVLCIIAGILAGTGFILWMLKKTPGKKITIIHFSGMLLSVPLFFYGWNNVFYHRDETVADVRMNKSFYFYYRTFEHFFLDPDYKKLSLDEVPVKEYQETFSVHHYTSEEYPFLHTTDTRDVLAPFFSKSDTLPDIVVLIMEGLSEEYMHNYHGISAMPFLDSLSDTSLYWNRIFSSADRSFAAVPSIIGSLPYAETGFNFMERLPRHISMASWLKQENYHTAFYIAQGAWFHENDKFFKKNNASLIFDKESFDDKYNKVITGADNFFWGFHDKDMYAQCVEVMKKIPSPRLDILFSGSMHAPYAIAEEEYYTKLLHKKMDEAGISQKDRGFLLTYKKYILTLLFTNDALVQFFEDYKKLPSYKNTIFIITGDHPMSELPYPNSMGRYHVPLIIYSPLLKRTKTFLSTGSHLDIFPTMMAFLHKQYHLSVPKENACLGGVLDTQSVYTYKRPMMFMNDNREMIDLFYNDYFMFNEKLLYKVDGNFNLTEVNDPGLLEEMKQKLDYFRKVNYYACFNDKIIPGEVYFNSLKTEKLFTATFPEISVDEKTEYFELCPEKNVSPGKILYFDLAADVEITGDSLLLPIGTYAVANEKDSTVVWNSFSLQPWQKLKSIDHHIRVEVPSAGKSYTFTGHIWNNKKGKIVLRNVKIDVYGEE